ncbi:hypothetical protein L1987_85748 [Smallanthus sonchifolius]|uniref:Uncharacterized protein n=1 Tax=Smallanthus sonchifolius TaxID=185202 RepID=A0ACB8XXE8_9ASTR|nr:hypothetical protein L1987_85748 [Smallanthus sonchifolius]
MIGLACKNFGFLVKEPDISYLPGAQEGLLAYLPSTQEEDPAYLPSAQEVFSPHLSSAHEHGPAHLDNLEKLIRCPRANGQKDGLRRLDGKERTDKGCRTDLSFDGRFSRAGRLMKKATTISLNVWTQADYGTNARMLVWVANTNASTEESVHAEHTESVHETNVTPTGDVNQGPIQLEPKVRDATDREVVLTLKNISPDLLSEALKKSKEEDEGNNEEKIYDSDGDEVRVASSNRGCTYKGFKDGDPPKFDGNKDSVATFEWIERMNAVINISECRPDQAVKYVAHSFTNEALSWWRNIQRTKSPNALARMTWEDLKKLIIQKFCP